MQITEDMIDFYKVLGCSPETVSVNNIEALKMCEEIQSYPPRFKLLFSPDGSPNENTQVKLSLHGLTNKYCATVELLQVHQVCMQLYFTELHCKNRIVKITNVFVSTDARMQIII